MKKLLIVLLFTLLVGSLVGCGSNTSEVTGEIIAINPERSWLGDSTRIYLADGTHIWASYYIDLPVGEVYTFVLGGVLFSGDYKLIRVRKPRLPRW